MSIAFCYSFFRAYKLVSDIDRAEFCPSKENDVPSTNDLGNRLPPPESSVSEPVVASESTEWMLLISEKNFRLWKRPIPNHDYLSEYKCVGTYEDLSAIDFYNAQVCVA